MAGEFNVNGGRDDIVGMDHLGRWRVGVAKANNTFDCSKWGQWSASRTWYDVQFGDFNGDGRIDIVGRNERDEWWVSLSGTGTLTTTLWGDWL